MKKISMFLICFVLIFILASVNTFAIIGYSSSLTFNEVNDIKEMVSKTLKVDTYSTEVINGINEKNKYVLVEGLEKGYLIYNRKLKDYVEYAEDSSSPYRGITDKKIYVAPTYYYRIDNNNMISVNNEMIIPMEGIKSLKSLEKDIDTNYKVTLNEASTMSGNDLPTQAEVPCKYYFEKLSNNMGSQTLAGPEGCCGFVAITTILSYFDSYLNDTIIPEEYDEEVILKDGVDSIVDYYNPPGITYEFQYLLMDFAMDNGIIHGNYGITIKEAKNIMTEYIINERGLEALVFQCNNLSEIKEAIVIDNPVLIGIQGRDTDLSADWISHAVVGYAYDEIGIIANFLDGGYTPAAHINKFTLLGGVFVHFYMPHVHTTNYHKRDGDKCMKGICLRDEFVSQHENCFYSDMDLISHRISCADCGYQAVELHRYKRIDTDYYVCEYCHYVSDCGFLNRVNDKMS